MRYWLGAIVAGIAVLAIFLGADIIVWLTTGEKRDGERVLMFIILWGSLSRFFNAKV